MTTDMGRGRALEVEGGASRSWRKPEAASLGASLRSGPADTPGSAPTGSRRPSELQDCRQQTSVVVTHQG